MGVCGGFREGEGDGKGERGWVMGRVRGTDLERDRVIGRVRVCVVGNGWDGVGLGEGER